MNHLPSEIIVYNIGLNLDVSSIFNLSCTCKNFDDIFKDAYFIKLYHDTYVGYDSDAHLTSKQYIHRIYSYIQLFEDTTDTLDNEFSLEKWAELIGNGYTQFQFIRDEKFSLENAHEYHSADRTIAYLIFQYDRLELFLHLFKQSPEELQFLPQMMRRCKHKFYDYPRLIEYFICQKLVTFKDIQNSYSHFGPKMAKVLMEYSNLWTDNDKSYLFWDLIFGDSFDLWLNFIERLNFSLEFWTSIIQSKHSRFALTEKYVLVLIQKVPDDIISSNVPRFMNMIPTLCRKSSEFKQFYTSKFSSLSPLLQQKLFRHYHSHVDTIFDLEILEKLLNINPSLCIDIPESFLLYFDMINELKDFSRTTFGTLSKLYNNSRDYIDDTYLFCIFRICLENNFPMFYCQKFAYLPSQTILERHHEHIRLTGSNDKKFATLLPTLLDPIIHKKCFMELFHLCGLYQYHHLYQYNHLTKSLGAILTFFMTLETLEIDVRCNILFRFCRAWNQDKYPSFVLPPEVAFAFMNDCMEKSNDVFCAIIDSCKVNLRRLLPLCITKQQKCFLVSLILHHYMTFRDFQLNLKKLTFHQLMRLPLHKVNNYCGKLENSQFYSIIELSCFED